MNKGVTTFQLNGKPCTQAEFEAAAGGTIYDTIRFLPEGVEPKVRDRIPEDDFYEQEEAYGFILRSPLLPADYKAICDILRNVGDSPDALIEALTEAGFTVVK